MHYLSTHLPRPIKLLWCRYLAITVICHVKDQCCILVQYLGITKWEVQLCLTTIDISPKIHFKSILVVYLTDKFFNFKREN